MNSKNVLIFGGSGLLGKSLQRKFPKELLLAPLHNELDLLNISKVFFFIERSNPAAIIYSSGVTKVDLAENNKNLALDLNYRIPKKISKFVARSKIPFIYISTDAVFDGYERKYFFSENDKPNPRSTYGISKYKGEESILENGNLNSAVRLINLFSLDKENFVSVMIDTLRKMRTFPGIIDQIRNPLYVETAAKGISFIFKKELSGIYHLGALDYDSNYNFLVKIADKFNFDIHLIKKIKFNDFVKNRTGHRKKKSILLCDKFISESENKILQTIDMSIEHLR